MVTVRWSILGDISSTCVDWAISIGALEHTDPGTGADREAS